MSKTQFTIPNLFKFWLKMWPLTLILTVFGFIAGVYLASQAQQSYSGTISILVTNMPDNVVASDYSGIINSKVFVARILEDTNLAESSCVIAATNTGNILNVSTQCPKSEDVETVQAALADTFVTLTNEIYATQDPLTVTTLTSEFALPLISASQQAFKVFALTVAGFLFSAVITFIVFDYKTSKDK